MLTMRMITESTAAGDTIPPHFRYLIAAQSEESMLLWAVRMQSMPNVNGQFGYNIVRE